MRTSRSLAALCLVVILVLVAAVLEARKLGDVEGRWVFIAGSPNGAEVFVDPASIVFDKTFASWVCWVRILDPQLREEAIAKYLYRNAGQDYAIIASITYDTISQSPKNWVDAQGTPKWFTVIPDSFADNVWTAIQMKTSPQ